MNQPPSENRIERFKSRSLLEPDVLAAAHSVYHLYLEVHSEQPRRPFGIAVSRDSYRGQLIFSPQPILLPNECFVTFNDIESEIY